MKLLFVLMLCVLGATAASVEYENLVVPSPNNLQNGEIENQNIMVNVLVRQLIAYLRRIINGGSSIFGIPPLDPLVLEEYHLSIPAGLINLDLNLKDVLVTGFGGFVVHRSYLNLSDLTFDLDISVPNIDINAGEYDLYGDLYSAIPLYGNGKAKFLVDSFRFRAKLFLKQSDDKKSILIERIESPWFEIPKLESGLTGVIGGGDIDLIVNAITEEVIMDYVNRFQAIIAKVTAEATIKFGNPILDQLNTWKYIAPLLPKPKTKLTTTDN